MKFAQNNAKKAKLKQNCEAAKVPHFVLATKSDKLCSVSRIHMAEGKK